MRLETSASVMSLSQPSLKKKGWGVGVENECLLIFLRLV